MLILGIRIPKSTLNYWEINYEFIKEIKDVLMKILISALVEIE